jgi:hypothetical protein
MPDGERRTDWLTGCLVDWSGLVSVPFIINNGIGINYRVMFKNVMMGSGIWVGALAVILVVETGCQSTKTPSFAPLDVKLSSPAVGGARALVVINTSGQTLHHLRFTGEIQNNHMLSYPPDNFSPGLPNRVAATTYVIRATDATLAPGQAMRFRTQSGHGAEGALQIPASDILISGKCDEGSFRQGWRVSATGEVSRE